MGIFFVISIKILFFLLKLLLRENQGGRAKANMNFIVEKHFSYIFWLRFRSQGWGRGIILC